MDVPLPQGVSHERPEALERVDAYQRYLIQGLRTWIGPEAGCMESFVCTVLRLAKSESMAESVEGDDSQWWITEMRDNLGRRVATDAG